MWGVGINKSAFKNLVVTKIHESISSPSLVPQDTQSMRLLTIQAQDLILNNKPQQAIPLLETALPWYKQESLNPKYSDEFKVMSLLDVLQIQSYLSFCYSVSQDEQKFLKSLDDILETTKLIAQIDYLKQREGENMANLIQTSFSTLSEIFRQRLDSDPERLDALEQVQPILQKLMKVFVEFGNPQQALLIAESSKSRAFLDLLTARLSTSDLLYRATQPTIQQLQEIARIQNATLVEYSIVGEDEQDSELFIWVIQPTGKIAFRKVDLQATNINLEKLVACARLDIAESRGGTEKQSNSQCQPGQLSWLRQLDRLLIEPIADLLPPKEQDRIIFIPHQQLFLVPFPALQDTNNQYLIEKHTILTAPSLQSLSITHQHKKEGQDKLLTGDVLLVGNPTMPKIKVGNPPQQLQPLKGAENEVKAIAEQLSIIKTFNIR